MNPLQGKNIVLGITGSIAAYKAAEIASNLTKAGALVNPVLTPSGEKFITALTLHSVTGRHASVDADLWEGDQHVTHIQLGHTADLILIAPASANFMGKLANGFGDSLLALSVLASHCPRIIAPAMDGDMYMNPATQANVATLKARGFQFVGPGSGHLASGLSGVGRMSDPAEIVGAARFALSRGGKLAGKRVVVTAGGTQEAIDPVRFISNRSSGKQGYAIAQAALDEGADVTLISAPTALTPPCGCSVVQIASAAEMLAAVETALAGTDALIMCAAVADFKPEQQAAEKIKKDGNALRLDLAPTVDILAAVAEKRSAYPKLQAVLGFAAESQDLLKNAASKLSRKKLDLIVANDISAKDSGFAVDQNQAVFLFRDGSQKALPLMRKTELAEQLITELINLLNQ